MWNKNRAVSERYAKGESYLGSLAHMDVHGQSLNHSLTNTLTHSLTPWARSWRHTPVSEWSVQRRHFQELRGASRPTSLAHRPSQSSSLSARPCRKRRSHARWRCMSDDVFGTGCFAEDGGDGGEARDEDEEDDEADREAEEPPDNAATALACCFADGAGRDSGMAGDMDLEELPLPAAAMSRMMSS